MKRSTVFTFCGIVAIVLFAASENLAQTRPLVDMGSSKQEQVMHELLDEVHQLRLAVQHISVNAYRGQVMVERLRVQHEQVGRLTRELDEVRNQIGELRATQQTTRERLSQAEKQQDTGVLSEASVSRVRAAVDEATRRQQSLTERENQLSGDLAAERANLADLNKRLDALEREMLVTGDIEKSKDSKKR